MTINMDTDILEVKRVYVGMCADIIHIGHINLINRASRLGLVTVGLLTDEAISGYKSKPLIPFGHRVMIVSNIKGVYQVIPQSTLDYTHNLRILKPDYVVHGDDWKEGVQSQTREKVIDVLKEWNGKLIEVKYTKGVSSSLLKNKLQ